MSNPLAVLSVENSALVILPQSPKSPLWTSIWLHEGEAKTDLGADSLEVIVSRFLSALLNPQRQAATDQSINGSPVVWLLSLMECHHSIYYCSNQSNLTLYVQDPKAKLIKKMILTQSDIQRWARILSEIEVS
tara:strand:+ start:54 stop:452 length:399 start_codon:yes stop_codon:yes gene_type:complete